MVSVKTIKDLGNLSEKTVFLRADLNVPMNANCEVTDLTRIERTVPTIKELLKMGAKVVIATHFGRPKGQRQKEFSVEPIAAPLEKFLGVKVTFLDDCIGEKIKQKIKNMQQNEVVLLENLRFYTEEEKNDLDFAKSLMEGMDIYVSDAFSTSHRAHASTYQAATLRPHAAGLLMQEELEALEGALTNPKRPVAAIVGGSKVSTKLDVLTNLIDKVDMLIIGGGMANTFLYAKGVDVGNSLCEKDMAETALKIMDKAKQKNCEIFLPDDVVIADNLEDGKNAKTVNVNDVPTDKMILDIGENSVKSLIERLKNYKTLVWNGPVGAFEYQPFNKATFNLAKEVAKISKTGELLSVAGGGDTVAALEQAEVSDDISYISTAGGAFLEWLEGKKLPGVEALK